MRGTILHGQLIAISGDDMNDSLAALEQRVAALEAQLATLTTPHSQSTSATRLVAPVEVVTAEGQVLLSIHQQPNASGISLHNSAGNPVATLGVDGTQAGYLSIRDAAGRLVGSLDVETAGARLILQDHEENGGIVLFGGDSGDNEGGGINILHSAGGLSMSLWSDTDGGQLIIYDGQAQGRELLTLPTPLAQS